MVALKGYEADYNPALEMGRWLERIGRNQAMLRAIAGSGPQGAYAQQALDALAEAAGGPQGRSDETTDDLRHRR